MTVNLLKSALSSAFIIMDMTYISIFHLDVTFYFRNAEITKVAMSVIVKTSSVTFL